MKSNNSNNMPFKYFQRRVSGPGAYGLNLQKNR